MPVVLSDSLTSALAAAATDARRRSHRALTVEHLLVALLADAEVRDVLVRCGVDVIELDRELREYLDLLEPRRGGLAGLDEHAHRITARAAMHGHHQNVVVGVRDVLARIPGEPETYAAMLLHAAGVAPIDLLRVLAHGTLETDLVIPEGPWLAIRVYNDSFTPQRFVVEVLERVLRMSVAAAQSAMLQIHRSDSAIIATLRRDLAIEKAQRVVQAAKDSDVPLRCTLEPAE